MKPLRLALVPILPSRTPSAGACFEYGFGLRLPGGPYLEKDDPLFDAYGAGIFWLDNDDHHDEALQHEAFDPGRRVQLLAEPFDPDDPNAVGVWDAESLRQAGTLPQHAADVVSAAVDSGLEQSGLLLVEHRAAADDRRERLCLLVHSPALVRVRIPADLRVERPPRPSRPRLVLVADGSGEVRWWDPSGDAGPLEAGDVGLSPALSGELERLRERFAALAGDGDERRGFERVELDWEREALNSKAADLWERARSELGRRYAIGFLGSGMRRPVWSPAELTDDEDEYGLS